MIYLTNDALVQAVYFELRSSEPHRMANGVERVYIGLLGNGIHEVAVTMKKSRGGVDIAFGPSELFSFVPEDDLRRMLGEVVKGRTLH